MELLAHRVTWSAVVMGLLVLLLRRGRRALDLLRVARTRRLLMVAAVLISINWGMFIYGVNSGQVVEVSLGYFINPLVTVLAGVLVIGEKLRPTQWVALGIAAAAVVGLTIAIGSPPWIALTLAFSFAGYGLVRKKADVGAVEGLTVETLLVVPLALGYLWWLGAAGQAQSLEGWPWHLVLLATSGLVTALPLICFGGAATRVPLTTLGLLQYGTPTLHFVIGVFLYGEEMPTARWSAFAAIWFALALFTVDSLRHRQRQLTRLRVEASGA